MIRDVLSQFHGLLADNFTLFTPLYTFKLWNITFHFLLLYWTVIYSCVQSKYTQWPILMDIFHPFTFSPSILACQKWFWLGILCDQNYDILAAGLVSAVKMSWYHFKGNKWSNWIQFLKIFGNSVSRSEVNANKLLFKLTKLFWFDFN